LVLDEGIKSMAFLLPGYPHLDWPRSWELEIFAEEDAYGHHELELGHGAEVVAFAGEDAGFVEDF